MRPIAVIPSRYAAVRFPAKPLALLLGKPMVQHVWERCTEAKCFEQVIVATDDLRIAMLNRQRALLADFQNESFSNR